MIPDNSKVEYKPRNFPDLELDGGNSDREVNKSGKQRHGTTESIVEPGCGSSTAATSPNQKMLPKEYALSFSGCGFLGCYHFGVLSCFNKNGPRLIKDATKIAGTSMGSLVAALIIFNPTDLKIDSSCATLYELAETLNNMRFGAMTPGFDLNAVLLQQIEAVIPQDITPAQDKLYICVTHYKLRTTKLISKFPNREYLIKCLLASCYIPMYTGSAPVELDGELYIDGGYTENLPVFKEMFTITISPFSGGAIISPIDQNFIEWRMKIGNQTMKVNMHNIVRGAQALFPPTSRTLHAYYEMGFRDAMRFLLNNGYLERVKGTEV